MSVLARIRAGIASAVRRAALAAVEAWGLDPAASLPEFTVEVPREKEHGDLATNLALLLARPARRHPREIAATIAARLDLRGTWVKEVKVAGPGFINFHLDEGWLDLVLPDIEEAGDAYGATNLGGGKKVQVEFVSANPTGLLHMGNARGAALGDSIAAILSFTGFDVTREFYINDAGQQVENLALSVEARYLQELGYAAPMPENGYFGEDLIATARRFIAAHGAGLAAAAPEERRRVLLAYTLKEKLDAIKASLEAFGVAFDVWFSESTLHAEGAVRRVIEELTARGHTYEKEGALWFRATTFGADKDEVLVRQSGVPTYFAADVAYHKNKFDRGFTRVIDIWGADHHGHVARVKGALAALGYDAGALEVVLMQLVRLYQGGEPVRMSKRTGRYVTLDELLEEVGRDAARYFFVMRSADSHLDFDLDLARRRSNENPVYYVQYAHARIASIFRQLAARGGKCPPAAEVDPGLLREPAERALIRRLADFPDEVLIAALELAPHRIALYAHDVAGLFHSFYNAYRVLGAGEGLEEARLVLVHCTGTVLRNALRLIGVGAPERM